MSLFYSNPQCGQAGIFTIPHEYVNTVAQLNCLRFGRFFAGNFCAISPTNIWRILFGVFSSRDFTFSLILNVFNINF